MPEFQGISSRLSREVRCPSQNVATLAFAWPIESQPHAFADFKRFSLESKLDVALHIIEDGFHSFLENFPGGLRGLDVAPLVAAGAGVKILVIQRSYFVFNLGSNVLILQLLQE